MVSMVQRMGRARNRDGCADEGVFAYGGVILPILLLSTLACGFAGDARGSSKYVGGDWISGNSYWYVPPADLEAIFQTPRMAAP